MRPAQLFEGNPQEAGATPWRMSPYPVDRHSLTSGKSQPCVSSISGQGHPQSPATLPDGNSPLSTPSHGDASGYLSPAHPGAGGRCREAEERADKTTGAAQAQEPQTCYWQEGLRLQPAVASGCREEALRSLLTQTRI